jgi:hypothetical protein
MIRKARSFTGSKVLRIVEPPYAVTWFGIEVRWFGQEVTYVT